MSNLHCKNYNATSNKSAALRAEATAFQIENVFASPALMRNCLALVLIVGALVIRPTVFFWL